MDSIITDYLSSVILLGFCSSVIYLYVTTWLKLRRVQDMLRKQGIEGPSPSLFSGNLSAMKKRTVPTKEIERGCYHDYTKYIFPYFDRWRKDYGPVYLYWMERRPALYVTDPAIIRDISRCVSLDLGKPRHHQKGQEPLFGRGILKSNGPIWAHQRKVIAPEFYMGKVMVELMNEIAMKLVNSWGSMVDHQGGTAVITVDKDLMSFSADVISRAIFGSNYATGKEIFLRLTALSKEMTAKQSFLFELPYWRFLPSKRNRVIRRLEQEIHSLILEAVQEHRERCTSLQDEDLLLSILRSDSMADQLSSDAFIVDNCKSIYLAGHETTAVNATWCMMLLGAHPDWQARARAEVVEVCGGRMPDFKMIQMMKTLTMVIQETLRLFPPSSFVVRETFQDMKFGHLHIPKGTNLWIPISTMHHDQALWGLDADEFNPERFAGGVSGACELPQGYMPFGLGARTCVGQNLAMVELKIFLSLILANFTFSLSPKYCHSPSFQLTVRPEFGLPLVVKRRVN
ncbi:cytochrome P450 714D1-like isoform X2 [Typha latifolia]|uniref:cytochrome P450 714D1-like isoform X2 n=1 Tax=Typha latifolia TaxID=4733 RepID=UPI003C2B7ABD